MAIPKRSDSAQATDCDWAFLDNPSISKVLRARADKVASHYGVDSDDLFQEAVLFLAVRPEAVANDMSKGSAGPNFVGFRAYNVMLDRAKAMRSGSSYDDYPEADSWWDGNEG
jgi:hypothetical protein